MSSGTGRLAAASSSDRRRTGPRRLAAFGAASTLSAALVSVVGIVAAPPAAAATKTFSGAQLGCGDSNPAPGSYKVPANVTELRITAAGGSGHDGDTSEVLATHGGGVGGQGGLVTADIPVTTPGETLYFFPEGGGLADYSVGVGPPQFPNGAGNGGSGTFVSLDPNPLACYNHQVTHPLLVAGGGGGGGYGDYLGPGGTGGNAGDPATGGNPGDDNHAPAGAGGGGATSTAAGGGGAAGHGGAELQSADAGNNGSFEFGGWGGVNGYRNSSGGAGGGGYYGGGGGGGSADDGGGGGGGGSNFVDPSATNVTESNTNSGPSISFTPIAYAAPSHGQATTCTGFSIVSGNNQTAPSGSFFSQSLETQLTGCNADPSNDQITFTSSDPASLTTTSPTAPSGSDGVAQVAAMAGTVTTPTIVTVTASTDLGPDPLTFTLTVSPPGGSGTATACSTFTASAGNNQTITSGAFFPIALQTQLSCTGDPSGSPITFVSSNPAAVTLTSPTATTGSDGTAIEAADAGTVTSPTPVTITASTTLGPSPVTFSLTVLPPGTTSGGGGGGGSASAATTCTGFSILSGNHQTATAGSAFGLGLTTQLTGCNGDPTGAPISFTSANPAAVSLNPPAAPSGPDGIALDAAQAGSVTTPTTVVVTATTPLGPPPVQFSLTVVPASAGSPIPAAACTGFTITAGDNQTATNGAAFATALGVTLSGCSKPYVGTQISFTSSNPAVANPYTPSAVVGADGIATIAIRAGTVTTSTPVTITASTPLAAAPLTFHLMVTPTGGSIRPLGLRSLAATNAVVPLLESLG